MPSKLAKTNTNEGNQATSSQRRAVDRPRSSVIAAALPNLQNSYGNLFVQRLLNGAAVQRKCACNSPAASSGACTKCDEQRYLVQRQARAQAENTALPHFIQVALRASGQPLDPVTRAFMERRFGYDFNSVRIHTDMHADQSSQRLNAYAYTLGRDIFFSAGQYQPHSRSGRRLLAHELAHVIQQKHSPSTIKTYSPVASGAAEREADLISEQVVAERPVAAIRQPVFPGQLASAPKSPAATGVKAERLEIDVLGADTSLSNVDVRAAAMAIGTDIRVTSIEDMVGKLTALVGPEKGNRCVGRLVVWNHGRPGEQIIAGFANELRKPGKPDEYLNFPFKAFTADWLFLSAHQSTLHRLRQLLCCDAQIEWRGCAVAGISAEGGVRSPQEIKESFERYERFGDVYQDAPDVARHKGSLLGATFGAVMIQNWADATCATIRASNEVIVTDRKNPGFSRVWPGGKFIETRPREAAHCRCDARQQLTSDWHIEAEKRFNIQETMEQFRKFYRLDADKPEDRRKLEFYYDWHIHLSHFRTLASMRNRAHYTEAKQAVLKAIINDAASGLTIPPGLPVKDVDPWTIILPENVKMSLTHSGEFLPHLMICYPDNCWRWMVFTQHLASASPTFVRSALAHEMLHADDNWQAYQKYRTEYRRTHQGREPEIKRDLCQPGKKTEVEESADAFGEYFRGYRDFYKRLQNASAHIDIYFRMTEHDFDRWTDREKVDWFRGVLNEFPPDASAAESAAERKINDIFTRNSPDERTLRENLAITLEEQLRDKFITSFDKAFALLEHFKPIWRIMPDKRWTFIYELKKMNKGREILKDYK